MPIETEKLDQENLFVLEQARIEIAKKDYIKATVLLEADFDDHDVSMANHLGYIYLSEKNPRRELAKAEKYYRISAEMNNAYGQQGLAACLKRLGKMDEAIMWLMKSSANERHQSSYLLYHYFHQTGDIEQSKKYLACSARQGNVLAAQRMAWLKCFGKFGFRSIPAGVVELFRNSPKAIRYGLAYVESHPHEFEKQKNKLSLF